MSPRSPYITSELRPRVVPKLDTLAPHNPEASNDDLKARALEVLGVTEEQWRARYPETASDEIWGRVYSRNPDVTWNTLDLETVLLNVETSKYYTLNQCGTLAWESFEDEISLNEILDKICSKFNVSKDVASRDLLALTGQLQAEGLVKL